MKDFNRIAVSILSTISQIDEFLLSIAKLPKLSETILRIAKEQGRVTVSDVLAYEKLHRNTVKKHLNMLLENRYLER